LSLIALAGYIAWSGIIFVLILSPLVSYIIYPFLSSIWNDWRLILDGLRRFFLPYFF
jgi:hypothetical protein